MFSTELIDFMVGKFALDHNGTGENGLPFFRFDQPFNFTLIELDEQSVTLVAPLDFGDSINREIVLHRLLESNLQGCETGAGAICMIEGFGICYRETIDLKDISMDAFQSRFVDFSLYAYYWLSEGIKIVQDETSPPIMGEGMIRL